MSRSHIGHSNITRFAQEKVNLPKDKANEYRAQVNRLREKLEGYVLKPKDVSNNCGGGKCRSARAICFQA